MIRVELPALSLIMKAWVVGLTLQEAKIILHLVLCGYIEMASSFCARHLGLNFFPSFSPIFRVLRRTAIDTVFFSAGHSCVPSGGWSRNEKSCWGQPRSATWSHHIFLNACYRLGLGRLGHSRTLLFFHLRRTDKIHACLIFLRPATLMLTSSSRFKTVRHT